ncbi:Flp pilus assembly protein CpaB [Chelativorans sp. YIM 93263]|uniref:Flp pilus assembly protein CpaB n=1 Tax=Chelativorans sp. YIM 93263 TaxID=2906648 RepID=UPI0023786C69|nr:Flp pilus assembly protein CpaB [Chelativorans sp. YIM 93263]
MNKTRIVILGVAVVAAIGAGFLAKNLATPEPQVASAPPGRPPVEMKDVLTLASDVPMGEPVGAALHWQEWPAEAVSPGFITRKENPDAVSELQEAVARVPLYTGEPLSRNKLVGAGESFMSAILPSGKRAVATRIAADTSAGGFILPNDHVDVIMARRADDPSSSNSFVTETVLENVRVLAIDQTLQEDEDGRRVKIGETATLELTAEEAEIITAAQEMADRLTLALRSKADANETAGKIGRHLVVGAGRGNSVRLIKSGDVTNEGTR